MIYIYLYRFTNFLKELYTKWINCKLNDENFKTSSDKLISNY